MKLICGGAFEAELLEDRCCRLVYGVDEQDANADAVGGCECGQDRVPDQKLSPAGARAVASMARRPISTAGTGLGALGRTLPGRLACSTATADSV